MLFVGAARAAVGLRCCSAPREAQGAPGAKKGPSCGMWHHDNPDSPSVVMGWCQFPFLLKDKITSRLSFLKTTQPRNAVGWVQLWGPAPTVFLLFFHCFPTAPSAPTGVLLSLLHCSQFSQCSHAWKMSVEGLAGGCTASIPSPPGQAESRNLCLYLFLPQKKLKKKKGKGHLSS